MVLPAQAPQDLEIPVVSQKASRHILLMLAADENAALSTSNGGVCAEKFGGKVFVIKNQ